MSSLKKRWWRLLNAHQNHNDIDTWKIILGLRLIFIKMFTQKVYCHTINTSQNENGIGKSIICLFWYLWFENRRLPVFDGYLVFSEKWKKIFLEKSFLFLDHLSFFFLLNLTDINRKDLLYKNIFIYKSYYENNQLFCIYCFVFFSKTDKILHKYICI